MKVHTACKEHTPKCDLGELKHIIIAPTEIKEVDGKPKVKKKLLLDC